MGFSTRQKKHLKKTRVSVSGRGADKKVELAREENRKHEEWKEGWRTTGRTQNLKK